MVWACTWACTDGAEGDDVSDDDDDVSDDDAYDDDDDDDAGEGRAAVVAIEFEETAESPCDDSNYSIELGGMS